MRHLIVVLIIQLYVYAQNDAYDKNCLSCHKDLFGISNLNFEKISREFTNYEFLQYMLHEKNKFSIHSDSLSKDKNTKTYKNIHKSSTLSYEIRNEITEYIYQKYDKHQCGY